MAKRAKKVCCSHPGCRKELTQPYAQEMGECVSCCLKRLRKNRGGSFFVGYRKVIEKRSPTDMVYGTTDRVKIEEKRAYHREYYRTYRARRRLEGFAS